MKLSLKKFLVFAFLIVRFSNGYGQIKNVELIPLKFIESAFNKPDSLRAFLLENGFKVESMNKNEENWALLFATDENKSETQSGAPPSTKLAVNIYSPMSDGIKNAIAIHIRKDKILNYKEQLLESIKKRYPDKKAIKVTVDLNTKDQREAFELVYSNVQKIVSVKIMDMNDFWSIVTFTVPKAYIKREKL